MTSPASAPIIVKPRMRIIATENRLHESLSFVCRLRAQHGAHRQLCDTRRDPLTLRVALAQSHMCKLRVGEHAVRHETIARAARSPGQVVLDDSEVIARHMRE